MTAAIRRSTQAIASLVLALAVVVFVFVLIAQASGRVRFVPVLSGSMSPWVDTGDVAVLEPHSADELAVGDVIAFEAPVEGSPLTLHRVIEIVTPAPELTVRTKGDANSSADPWSARLVDDQLWRATSHIDDLGAPVVLLNRAKTRFVLLAFASLVLGWWGMSAIWRDAGREGSDDDADDSVTPTAGASASARCRVAMWATVSIVMGVSASLIGLRVLGHGGAAAAFTDRATDAQMVSSGIFDPLTLSADVTCSGQSDRATVLLRWTSASDPVAAFEIYRGEHSGGPYNTRVGSVAGDVTTFKEVFKKLDGSRLYYVVRTANAGTPVEESNEVSAVIACDPVSEPVLDTPITTSTG